MMTDTKKVEYGKSMTKNAESILAITKRVRALYENAKNDATQASVIRTCIPSLAMDCVVATERYFHELKDQADPNTLRDMQFAIDELVDFMTYLDVDSRLDDPADTGEVKYAD